MTPSQVLKDAMDSTEHSVEELRRQMDEAKSKATTANLLFAAAQKRLHDRMCRDSGLMCKIATENKGRKMLVHDIEFLSQKPWRLRGFKLRKDGAVGSQEIIMYVDSCTISDGLNSEAAA